MPGNKKSLVLSRKLREGLTIFLDDEEINVSVTEIDKGRVRLRIQADDSIDILRDELLTDGKPLEKFKNNNTEKEKLLEENKKLKEEVASLQDQVNRANRYRRGYFVN